MANSWYDVFRSEETNVRAFPAKEATASDLAANSIPAEIIEKFEPKNPSTLASLLALQSDTVERLVRDNERLMDRVEKLLHIQEREQALRLQMQDQIMTLANQVIDQAATADPEGIIKETRKRLTAEIRPVLLALVEAVEENRGAQQLAGQTAESALPEYTTETIEVSFRGFAGKGKRPIEPQNSNPSPNQTSEKSREREETVPDVAEPTTVGDSNVADKKTASPEASKEALPYTLDGDDEKLFVMQNKLPKILMRPVEDLESQQESQKPKSRTSRLGIRFLGGK